MDLAGEDLIPLTDVPALFPKARLKLATLRAEVSRGRLKVFMIGRRQYTTRSDLNEMLKACREAANRPASTSTRPAVSGSSATVPPSSGLASLMASLPKRSERSPTT
jgi:hypothetical protein